MVEPSRPASTCPPTKKPSEKFMYDAVTPPSGPSTKMPSAISRRWYFQVPCAGSQEQRGAGGESERVSVLSETEREEVDRSLPRERERVKARACTTSRPGACAYHPPHVPGPTLAVVARTGHFVADAGRFERLRISAAACRERRAFGPGGRAAFRPGLRRRARRRRCHAAARPGERPRRRAAARTDPQWRSQQALRSAGPRLRADDGRQALQRARPGVLVRQEVSRPPHRERRGLQHVCDAGGAPHAADPELRARAQPGQR